MENDKELDELMERDRKMRQERRKEVLNSNAQEETDGEKDDKYECSDDKEIEMAKDLCSVN